MYKLGIIVPYRDRYQQLITFKEHIQKYLSNKEIDYEIIIIEQDDAKAFNRGKLLNIGYIYAKKLRCKYVIFHDIDMMPLDVNYAYSDIPLHLATNLIDEEGNSKEIFPEYFGGVTLFPNEMFERINGYSNNYWGWGYEDTDLLYRCKLSKLPLNVVKLKNYGGDTAALKFNGRDAYVKVKNIFNFREKTSIVISFYPDEFELAWNKKEDVFAAFGIPGYDCCINYNSYSRYTFEIFTPKKEVIHINSPIKKNYKTIIVVTINPEQNEISFWQDGQLIATKKYDYLYNYHTQKFFYLGCSNPRKGEDGRFFKGWINSFAVYNDILEKEEIEELSNNKYFGLTQNFGKYKSDYKLSLYYDAKFIKGYKLIDLSGNQNDGEIVNCEIVPYALNDIKLVEVPFRRQSLFGVFSHEENGYINGGWKHETTRYNQLKFYNEVEKGSIDTRKDGLNNCEFVEHGKTKYENITQITVGI